MPRSSTSLVLVVVALLTAPLAVAATDSGTSTPAIRALMLRGQALNEKYHLGQYAGPSKQEIRAYTLRGQALNKMYHVGQQTGPTQQEIRAYTLRGQALNRMYHVGQQTGPTQQEIRAYALRGQALNQQYHLGQYADSTGSSFPSNTVAFSAAAAFGLILLAFAGTLGVRRRHAMIPA